MRDHVAPRSYSTEANAKSAVRNEGLTGTPHRVRPKMAAGGKRRFVVVFKPELEEDRQELIKRGFDVE